MWFFFILEFILFVCFKNMELGLTSLSTIFQLYRGAQFYSWRTPEYSGKTINLSFLLHVTDGRMRVWRHKDTAYTPRNIQPTVPYGGGSVMVWGVFLMTANWILVTIQGSWWSVHQRCIATSCCPHFDNHPLATKPVYMDDNARHCRSRAVAA